MAVDYRASIVQRNKRIDSGEPVEVCMDCETPMDVPRPTHAPRCRFVAPPPAAKPKERDGVPYRGAGGKHRTTAVHAADGSLTISEMERRDQARQDETGITVTCAVEDCDWPGYEGPGETARDVARAHRETAHPNLTLKRRFTPTPPADGLEALERMDAGLPQVGSAPEPAVAEPAAPARRGGRKVTVTLDAAKDAVRAKVLELGRCPSQEEWRSNHWSPSHMTISKRFGGWRPVRAFAVTVLAGTPERTLEPPVSDEPAPAQASPTPEKGQPNAFAGLTADELIAVGRLMVTVGTFRELEMRDKTRKIVWPMLLQLERATR